jgi:sec-independent protein translocase protein TatA
MILKESEKKGYAAVSWMNFSGLTLGIVLIGPGAIALIGAAALLMFGPSKLPELGRAFGRTLKKFKNATKELLDDNEQEPKEINRS